MPAEAPVRELRRASFSPAEEPLVVRTGGDRGRGIPSWRDALEACSSSGKLPQRLLRAGIPGRQVKRHLGRFQASLA